MNKDKKVKVNKQKPSDACPARPKLIAIKCPLIQRQAALAAIPMLGDVECEFHKVTSFLNPFIELETWLIISTQL